MKLLFDADALIKLNRAGVLRLIAGAFDCLIPDEVYEEAVIKGKERGYSDAEEIEEIAGSNIEVRAPVIASRQGSGLGAGESAVLALASGEETQVIVSDDRQFVGFLSRAGLRHLVPAALIVAMVQQQVLTKAEAREALERLRPLIRLSSYVEARQELEKLETQ